MGPSSSPISSDSLRLSRLREYRRSSGNFLEILDIRLTGVPRAAANFAILAPVPPSLVSMALISSLPKDGICSISSTMSTLM